MPVRTLVNLWPLFFGLSLIGLAVGVQGSLLGFRAELEGFEDGLIGLVMSAYFAGFLTGFAFCSIYVVAESWLNQSATNDNRGQLLSVSGPLMVAAGMAMFGLDSFFPMLAAVLLLMAIISIWRVITVPALPLEYKTHSTIQAPVTPVGSVLHPEEKEVV